MSKQESLARHRLIIKKLRNNPSTFEEILEKLRMESDLHDLNFEISKRTFQRDLKEIEELYNIEIKNDRSKKVYYISNDSLDEFSERLFEVIDVFQLLNYNQSISKFVQFSTRKPMGTEHLNGLLYAIQNRFQIVLRYKKFDHDETENRLVEPYLIKEFKNRWYLRAYDIEKKEFRTYGIDRIQAMSISDKKFQFPNKTNPKEHYKDSFGIVGPGDAQPQEILLKFTNNQGQYIRTLPLHPSQQILEENGDEMMVRLKIVPTYDFLFELMSMGANLKVLEPQSLADEMKQKFREALGNYS